MSYITATKDEIVETLKEMRGKFDANKIKLMHIDSAIAMVQSSDAVVIYQLNHGPRS
jgi:hypothetical protein